MGQVGSGTACQTETLVVDTNEVSHLIVDLYNRQSINDSETACDYIWIADANFR